VRDHRRDIGVEDGGRCPFVLAKFTQNLVRERDKRFGKLLPDDLARAMLRLWGDPALCAELAERGRKRLAAYSWNTFVNGVSDIVSEGCERVRSGRSPQYPEGALNRLMAPQS